MIVAQLEGRRECQPAGGAAGFRPLPAGPGEATGSPRSLGKAGAGRQGPGSVNGRVACQYRGRHVSTKVNDILHVVLEGERPTEACKQVLGGKRCAVRKAGPFSQRTGRRHPAALIRGHLLLVTELGTSGRGQGWVSEDAFLGHSSWNV